jgi:phosphomethylpyrimidine synthase
MTQIDSARKGKTTGEMLAVAKAEGVTAEEIKDRVARGTVVIPCNTKRGKRKVLGVGEGLAVKVNANVGTSPDYTDVEREVAKLRAALEAGADAFMDLSTGGDLRAIRKRLLAESDICSGSVPIYEAAVRATREGRSIMDMTSDSMLDAIRTHAEDGMDFVTIHSGVTARLVQQYRKMKRVCGIVSRGGTFLAEWIHHHGKENPYYERFDDILEIAREYDLTLSLGDGMRPGALADSFDDLQTGELETLAGLAKRALAAGVQVIIEGPGHVPLNQIEEQVRLQKRLCNGAPFYVLGPIVTDIAPGYDHITSAIGGAIAAAAGADFLCYVTPCEHLALPGPEDVREGVIAGRIAAHAADIARGSKRAAELDRRFSEMRSRRDWKGMYEHCLDPVKARKVRESGKPRIDGVCSMCGEFCTYLLAEKDKKGENK